MSNSCLSHLIHHQAKKYGERIALKYRDYETESWIPVTWNQFSVFSLRTCRNVYIQILEHSLVV